MRFRLRYWLDQLADNAIEDPVDRRLAAVFQAILLAVLAIQGVAIAAFLIPGHVPLVPYLGGPKNGALMCAMVALTIVLVRSHGRYRLGIALTILMQLLFASVLVYGSRPEDSRGLLLLCLPLAFSMLLPRPAVFLSGLASIAVIVITVRWQNAAGVSPGSADRAATFSLAISLLAVILDQISSNYRRALDESVRRASDVEARNAELAQANERLREAIAERERAESELAQARKMEGLGVMAAGVAHDFNNLLAGIIGNADLLRLDAPGGKEDPRIDEILQTGRHASDLCRQLMQYAGDAKPSLQPVLIPALVADLSDRLRIMIPPETELRCDLDPDLPPVQADAVQIRQVVMNLLTNARDSIGEQPGRIEVEAGLSETADGLGPNRTRRMIKPGRCVRVSVSDTGCGMDEATLAKVFDPFFTTKKDGHGLGLASALGIIRAHGGGLYVQSVPGQGSRFTLLFPV